MAKQKADKKPARARYVAENHLMKNKIKKLTKYCKEHPEDKQTAARLAELMAKK